MPPSTIPGITWKGDSIDDVEILPGLPRDLLSLLTDTNGFILHEGALHVRGASLAPEWHSLRAAWRGPRAFHVLYESVTTSDIPFAQDQVGDQFLIREGIILRLSAETGEIELLADSIEDFFNKVNADIEKFLTVGLSHRMQPGQLLHAFPPFCLQDPVPASLRAVPASEVILFHADFAKQIRDIPDGGQVEFKIVD
jgi:hypothetical protein